MAREEASENEGTAAAGISTVRSAVSSSIVAVTSSFSSTPNSARTALLRPMQKSGPIFATRNRAERSPMVTRTGRRRPAPKLSTCSSVRMIAAAGPVGWIRVWITRGMAQSYRGLMTKVGA